MNDQNPQIINDRSSVTLALWVGTILWAGNPFPFFGLGPLQCFLPDAYYLRTIDQLRQAGMLYPLSSVFVSVAIQALVLLALAAAAFFRRSKKLAFTYLGAVVFFSIVPWLRFFSELNGVH